MCFYIFPLQVCYITESQSCTARKEKHILHIVVFFGHGCRKQPFQLSFSKERLLALFTFGSLKQFLKIALQVICGIFLGRFLLSFD